MATKRQSQRCDMVRYEYVMDSGVSSHQRPWHWGFLQVVKWKPQCRERWWRDTFLGSLGKRGFAYKTRGCRGALWTPAGAGRGVIVLHGCLFTMLTGLAYGAHPLLAASGCSSRVSSDPRLWGTSYSALIGRNAGPEGALGKQTKSSSGSTSGSSMLNGWSLRNELQKQVLRVRIPQVMDILESFKVWVLIWVYISLDFFACERNLRIVGATKSVKFCRPEQRHLDRYAGACPFQHSPYIFILNNTVINNQSFQTRLVSGSLCEDSKWTRIPNSVKTQTTSGCDSLLF